MADIGVVGTIYNAPIRVEYLNGDFDKAEEILKKANIHIVGRNVASVTPYHATIFVGLKDEEKAINLVKKAGIKTYAVEPYF
ncbi:MAG: hypothetical protein EVJ47_08740 [Candidatus Acidulodesulfobacterium ferriphilum]|jgi:hypothetical protein|uniref:DUF2007 domain-containing protein n=1 Tax=Candidatus Acidulodesulfobacterium ferriphilum TaxID=2597223 RepID=A0A519B989_9DELT|nr:MAG: hypothetical protein EVJ47_08740 [Candidatus Acidulodesulfobacterium ferriphilum]